MTPGPASFKLILMTDSFSEVELRRLDLNLLLVFSAVWRERSVARAAGRLYLGPSAVSMALARLREAVGDPLFVRTPAGMEPTPRAEALWVAIEPALAAIEAAVRPAGFDPAVAELTIRFGAPDDLEFALVPRLLERLAEEAPGVRLSVRPSDFRALADRLDRGDAELMLSALPERGLEARHRTRILHDETFAVLHHAKRLGRTGPLDLAVYLATPHAMVSIDGVPRSGLDDQLAALGHARRVAVTVAHFPTLPHILRRRALLANVPATAARLMAAEHGLEVHPPPFDPGTFSLGLAWHARTDADPAQAWFRALVEEEVGGLQGMAT